MAEFGKHKLTDAITPAKPETIEGPTGESGPTPATTAEQVRESLESEQARNAEASNRDHMIDIGRGNQQAGRQGQ